ncbi:MAG: response regulator [Deltaproteobacteria bacterium]|nr:response regulator [Deltaproteobacteria bacterium]
MKTILCIDDEPMILKALKRDLSPFARVLTAESAAEGLRIMAEEEEVSVVISDVRMPVMSGVELMQILRSHYPDCVRVLLTGHADVEMTLQAINDGQVYRFLQKPWTRDELHATVKKCLEQAGRLADAKKAHLDANMQQRRMNALDGLEHAYPGISQAPRKTGGVIELDPSLLDVSEEDLSSDIARCLS